MRYVIVKKFTYRVTPLVLKKLRVVQIHPSGKMPWRMK
jgi:hypothetical protein